MIKLALRTGSSSIFTWIDTIYIYLLYDNYFKKDYIDISFGLSHSLFCLQNILKFSDDRLKTPSA